MFHDRTGSAPLAWAVGVENTAILQARAGHRPLDEYALTGHDRHWRSDIDRIANLGVRAVRYGIPWHRVNPAPGRFDWSGTDPVIRHLVAGAGLTPILDLVHFGAPLWLRHEFLSPEYPARVAEYAQAVAERYGHLVSHYTPLNEPAVTATRCGRDGAWPPYRRGRRGHVAVLLSLMRGMIATAHALRSVQPEAVLVHAEDVGIEYADSVSLAEWAAARQRWRWLPLDLATGRVGPPHPRWADLLAGGALPGEVLELAEQAVRWDVLGVNFYPWSNHRWSRRHPDGAIRLGRDRADPAAALALVLREVHERYGLPLMLTETSASGSMARRLGWLRAVVEGVTASRAAGVPVLGLCWFPAFTMIDWRYRRSRRPVDDHLLHLGLWDIRPGDRDQIRHETPLVAAFRDLVQGNSSLI